MLFRWVVTMRIARIVLFAVLAFCLVVSASTVLADVPKERTGRVTVQESVQAPADAKDVRGWALA